MQGELCDELRRIEDAHWWLTTRRRIFLHFIREFSRGLKAPPLVLDCGCGTGRLIHNLGDFSRPVGIDLSLNSLRGCREPGPSMLAQAKIEDIPFKSQTFDIICAFDVLEHLDNDSAALDQMRNALKPDGYLFVSVPAYRFLWDAQDDLAEHKRRYWLGEVQQKLRNANFIIERATYFNSILFPLVALVRFFRKAQALFSTRALRSDFSLTPPGTLNDLLGHIFSKELSWLKRLDFPFGGSILCIARRCQMAGGREAC